MLIRCLGNCQCANCPQSGPGDGLDPSSRNKVLNPPLMFVIDTTKSVKPDKDSIFNLTKKVVDSIKTDLINIPRFTLVSFNDYGPDINRNVKVEVIVKGLFTNYVIIFWRFLDHIHSQSFYHHFLAYHMRLHS